MTNYEHIKGMNIDKFSEWVDKYGQFDSSPWMSWFEQKYCNNCESIMHKYKYDYGERELPCSYCELNDNCKFFPDLDKAPDNKEIIKMWLNAECKNK